MKRLFVVNGLFGFLNCLSATKFADHDRLTVLVLFSSDDRANLELELKMRTLVDIEKCVFLTDPEEYTTLFSDRAFMSDLCRSPGEMRMFFTHNTWLHNRIFAAYPKAKIILYEEGMASYYPGLIDKYAALDRVAGVYLHNYLDRFVSPDASAHPEKFGLLDRHRFAQLLDQVSTEPNEEILDPNTVVVVEQYLFKKGKAQSPEDAAAEYADAIRTIIERGYRVVYKRHPRESTRLFALVTDMLSPEQRSFVSEFPTSTGLLEEVIRYQRPAAIAAISSTSLLTIPQYFGVPSFIIRSRAPFDVAKAVPVERRGLTVNQVALTARVPSIDDLPSRLHRATAEDLFRSRFSALPRLCEDSGIQSMSETDFGPEYVELVRKIAAPDVRAVSFDLFDTLVHRPAVSPADIFALLDRQLAGVMPPFVRYSDVRSSVFRRLDAQLETQGGRPAEYSLAQVYDHIASVLDLDEHQRDEMLSAEIALESDLVGLRRSGYALTQVAEAYDKPWAITTDTYFDDAQLAEVALAKLPNTAHHVASSLHHQKTKAAGDLFDVTVRAFGVPKQSVLHIGDRMDHDVANAERAGLMAARLPSAAAAAQSHPRLREVWKGVREERASALLRGLCYSELFDNPYRDFARDSTCGGTPEMLGYLAVGPALIGWAEWILRTSAAQNCDSLLFLSRDGYLPMEICRRLAADQPDKTYPRMSYVLSSRRAMFDIFNTERGHIAYTEFVHGLSPKTTVRQVLTTRFGEHVAQELGPQISAAGPGSMDAEIGASLEKVKWALARNADAIVERCNGTKARADEYYCDAIGDAKNPAIVDVGYSGSAQRGISLAAGEPVGGLYFTTMEHNTEHAAINGLTVSEFTTDPVFFRSGGMLEYLITPPGLDSCNGFDPVTGAPLLKDSDAPDPVRDAVHAGIGRFIDDFFRTFAGRTDQFTMRPRLSTHMLASFMSDPSRADAKSLLGGKHENTVGSSSSDVLEYWGEGRRALSEEDTTSAQGTERELRRELNDARREIDRLRAELSRRDESAAGSSASSFDLVGLSQTIRRGGRGLVRTVRKR